MGLLTSTVMHMASVPVAMATLESSAMYALRDTKEPNAMNVKLGLPKILQEHA